METYIAKHKNMNVRSNSRSGGVFTAISDVILAENGVIYGCKLNVLNQAVHDRAISPAERDLFRGSKYVQSNLNGCFRKAGDDLKKGKSVLFTGTPCQIAGLKSFLEIAKIETTRLYTCSILCHYTTSPLLLKDYVQDKEAKFSGKVEHIDFRNKRKYGWAANWETVTVNGKEHDSTEYTIIFYSGVATRESCFHCPYKKATLPGDITLADAWGIDKADGDFNDNKGVSLLLIQTERGLKLLKSAFDQLEYRRVDFENYNKQKTFSQPYARPESKDAFWKTYYEKSYRTAYNKFLKVSLCAKVRRKLKQVFVQKVRR